MIINPNEKKVPCPLCDINIDLDTRKYGLNRPVIEECPWCGRKLRIKKILKIKPKEDRGLTFKLAACYLERKTYRGSVKK